MLRLCTKVTSSPTTLAAQVVGHLGHRRHLGTAGREQRDDLVDADLLAEQHAGQHLGHRAAGPGPARHQDRRLGRRPRVPRRAAGPDVQHLDAVRRPARGVAGLMRCTNTAPGSSRPSPSASLRSSTGSAGRRRASGRGRARTRGRWSGGGPARSPCASVTSRSRSRAGQGRSGLTWSAVTGETPPQSSMPASSSTPKSSDRLGGACRWTSGGRIRRARAMASR